MSGPTLFEQPPDLARFDGPEPDDPRLTGQLLRVWSFMSDHRWQTVNFIAHSLGIPQNSVQAQLRNLRKARFGSYLVERRKRGESGLYEYRVGNKGEGVPQHARFNHCETLEARIEELESLLVRQASRK